MPKRLDGSLVDDSHIHLTPEDLRVIHHRRAVPKRTLPKVPTDVPDLSSFGPKVEDEFGFPGPERD